MPLTDALTVPRIDELPDASKQQYGKLWRVDGVIYACVGDGGGGYEWIDIGEVGSGVTDHTMLTNIGTNTHPQIDTAISLSIAHAINNSNPHGVTKTQVGMGPGDPGDLKATNAAGTDVTNVKPGRIDARVRGLSTADSGSANHTILQALATEAAGLGAQLWIPDGEYRVYLDSLPSHLRMSGTGTLRAPTGLAATKAGVIDYWATGLEDVHISGLTFDGNGEVNPISITSSNSASPLVGGSVRGCTLINSGTAGDNRDHGLRLAHLRHWDIIGNLIHDVYRGMAFFHPGYCTIANNTFRDTANNAMSIPNSDSGIQTHGLQIIGNRGTGIGNIGIEITSHSAARCWSPLIADNVFAVADYGYSLVGMVDGVVRGNVAIAPNITQLYGFELGSQLNIAGMLVQGNVAHGFERGFHIHDGHGAQVIGNTSIGAQTGISVDLETWGVTVANNTVRNFRDVGIKIEGYNTSNMNGGHLVDGNTIIRDLSWTGDATRDWWGMHIERQNRPSRFRNNRIIQAQAAPTSGLTAKAIRVGVENLGEFTKSQIVDNTFIDRAATAIMATLSTHDSARVADMLTITGNVSYLSGSIADANSW